MAILKDRECGPQDFPKPYKIKEVMDKYWGSIQTVFSREHYACKFIHMKKGCQSSLEYHVNKVESYYIISGTLKLGIRYKRGENTSIILYEGYCYDLPKGMMHMRIALEDTVILEVSTADDDADSHIVEDGKTYKHEEIKKAERNI